VAIDSAKLSNFKKLYDDELKRINPSPLEAVILDSLTVRQFVYEVCKNLLLE